MGKVKPNDGRNTHVRVSTDNYKNLKKLTRKLAHETNSDMTLTEVTNKVIGAGLTHFES